MKAGNTFNILFTNVGRRVPVIRAFKEALASLGLSGEILGVDANTLSSAYYVTDRSFHICPISQDDYIPSLLEICCHEKVNLLISLLDTDLLKLAENREKFKDQGIFLLVSSPEVIRLASNKHLTHNFFATNGILTPRIWPYVKACRENPFPLFIKPLDGSASNFVFRIDDRESLEFFYRYVPEPLILEYVPGYEFTLDLFIDLKGMVRAIVPRKRLEVRAGEVSKSQIVLDPKIVAAGRKVAEALAAQGGIGVINVQAIYTPDGDLKFIEINPRFGGGSPLSMQAGYPFPQWSIEMVLGRDLTSIPQGLGDGLTMLRYDDAIFVPGEKHSSGFLPASGF